MVTGDTVFKRGWVLTALGRFGAGLLDIFLQATLASGTPGPATPLQLSTKNSSATGLADSVRHSEVSHLLVIP